MIVVDTEDTADTEVGIDIEEGIGIEEDIDTEGCIDFAVFALILSLRVTNLLTKN